jgi:hypothetical protein
MNTSFKDIVSEGMKKRLEKIINPPYHPRGHRVVMESDDGGKTWKKAESQKY